LTSEIVDGFFIKNFMSAFWGALLFSIFSIILGIDRNIAKNDPNINNNG
jgi:uncharacterized membrane protein YvlD (DUF360 family)